MENCNAHDSFSFLNVSSNKRGVAMSRTTLGYQRDTPTHCSMERNPITIDDDDDDEELDDFWEAQNQFPSRAGNNTKYTSNQHLKVQSGRIRENLEVEPQSKMSHRSGNSYNQLSTQRLIPGQTEKATNQRSVQHGVSDTSTQREIQGRSGYNSVSSVQGKANSTSTLSSNKRSGSINGPAILKDDEEQLEWLVDDAWMDSDDLLFNEVTEADIHQTPNQSSPNMKDHRETLQQPLKPAPLSSGIKRWSSFNTSRERNNDEGHVETPIESANVFAWPCKVSDQRQDENNR